MKAVFTRKISFDLNSNQEETVVCEVDVRHKPPYTQGQATIPTGAEFKFSVDPNTKK